jgi:hypothetical protein
VFQQEPLPHAVRENLLKGLAAVTRRPIPHEHQGPRDLPPQVCQERPPSAEFLARSCLWKDNRPSGETAARADT